MSRPSEDDREAVDRAFADLVAGYHLTSDRPDPLLDRSAAPGVPTARDTLADTAAETDTAPTTVEADGAGPMSQAEPSGWPEAEPIWPEAEPKGGTVAEPIGWAVYSFGLSGFSNGEGLRIAFLVVLVGVMTLNGLAISPLYYIYRCDTLRAQMHKDE